MEFNFKKKRGLAVSLVEYTYNPSTETEVHSEFLSPQKV